MFPLKNLASKGLISSPCFGSILIQAAQSSVITPGKEQSPMDLSDLDPKNTASNPPTRPGEFRLNTNSAPRSSNCDMSVNQRATTRTQGKENTRDFNSNGHSGIQRNLAPRNPTATELETRNPYQPPTGSFGSRKPLFSEKNEKGNVTDIEFVLHKIHPHGTCVCCGLVGIHFPHIL